MLECLTERKNVENMFDKSKRQELRGLITPDDDMYIWDSNSAVHGDVLRSLGLIEDESTSVILQSPADIDIFWPKKG